LLGRGGGGGGGCGCGCGAVGGCLVVVDAGVDAVGVVVAWLPFWVHLGDAASHVSNVGTCCPNLCNWRWPGSSAVKCMLTVTVEVGVLNPQNNKCFLHKIKLNWL
jgi:hypothetical protein